MPPRTATALVAPRLTCSATGRGTVAVACSTAPTWSAATSTTVVNRGATHDVPTSRGGSGAVPGAGCTVGAGAGGITVICTGAGRLTSRDAAQSPCRTWLSSHAQMRSQAGSAAAATKPACSGNITGLSSGLRSAGKRKE